MSLSTSSSYHCLSLRQQVDGCGYRSGRSFHLAPVLRIQRIPSKTMRSSARGRPPFGLGPAFGISGSIFFHCSSVNRTSRALIGSPPRSDLRQINKKYKTLFQTRYREVMALSGFATTCRIGFKTPYIFSGRSWRMRDGKTLYR